MEVKVNFTTPNGVPDERSMMVGLKSDHIRRRKFDMHLQGAEMAWNSQVTITITVGNIKFVGQLTTPRGFEKKAWWHTDELFCQLHGTHVMENGYRTFCAGKLHINLTRLARLDTIIAEEAAREANTADWFHVNPHYTPTEPPPPYPVSQNPSEVSTREASSEEELMTCRVVVPDVVSRDASDIVNRMRIMTQMIDKTTQYLDDMKALKEVFELYE